MPRIYISPSTQDHNIGAGNYGTEEQRMNQIADVVVALLQVNHFEVYRNKPEMTLQEAVADSNNRNVDAHFAIHSNAGGARGAEVFYLSSNGQKLAESVYKYVSVLTPVSDRGVKKNEHLYELNSTEAVAALVEVSFHDNPQDAEFIVNNISQLGEAIAHGICDYFGVDFTKPQPQKILRYPGLVKNGMSGDNIKYVQMRLNGLGFNCGTADGIFGAKTLAAVKAFQKASGLTVDGLVGPKTWLALFN